jgi:hypothetical protein
VRQAFAIAAAVCATLAVGAFEASAVGSSTTKWVGTVDYWKRSHTPPSRRPTVMLTIAGTAAVATFVGYSSAAHDPESTRAACTIRYRYVTTVGRFRYYHEGANHPTGVSVEDSPCETANYGALKATPVPGKLRADFGDAFPGDLFERGPIYRGYLRKAG